MFFASEAAKRLGLEFGEFEQSQMSRQIRLWQRVYSGSEFLGVKDPHIAATVCREAARLVSSELEVRLGISDRARYLEELINKQVISRAGEITEYACFSGGVIIKPRFDGRELKTDFVTQEQFVPTQYDAQGIYGGLFMEQKRRGNNIYTRLERYTRLDTGAYEVENRAFKSGGSGILGGEVGLDTIDGWSGLAPLVTITAAPSPPFAFFKMPFANFLEPLSPLGVSIFAKAIDSIRAATTAYNALDWEIEGGELKRFRDISTFTEFDRHGNPVPDSGRKKEAIFNGATGGDKVQLFDTFSPELRVDGQISALNRHLNQIEAQTGFSQGALSVDTQTGLMTATQVIADRQRTYSTIRDIQTKGLKPALLQLIEVYSFYADLYGLAPAGEVEPVFRFDDSIIESTADKRSRMQALVTAGRFPLWRYLAEYEGYSEKDAMTIQAEIN